MIRLENRRHIPAPLRIERTTHGRANGIVWRYALEELTACVGRQDTRLLPQPAGQRVFHTGGLQAAFPKECAVEVKPRGGLRLQPAVFPFLLAKGGVEERFRATTQQIRGDEPC